MNKNIVKSNYLNSRIDYSLSFLVLWSSFNGLYNNHSKKRKEIDRIRDFVTYPGVLVKYLEGMNRIKNPEDKRIKYLLGEIEQLSTREIVDSNGNKLITNIDTTGTKYKIISDNNDVHTKFLSSSILVENTWLSNQANLRVGRISLFFDKEKGEKSLFDIVYYEKYHNYIQNYMSFYYDAVKHIPLFLSREGILQYGEILFSEKEINFTSKLSNINTWQLTNEDAFDDFQCKSSVELLKLELRLLYGFRCALSHGALDYNDNQVNKFAKTAYEALDDIIGAII